MCDTPESHMRHILIVEDNPVLRRHLLSLLDQEGIGCILAKNEDEALEQDFSCVNAVVADVDLSEAGGDLRGGILLVEGLAERKIHVPVILISCTPPENINGSCGLIEGSQVRSILDRNDPFFRRDLISLLRKVLKN